MFTLFTGRYVGGLKHGDPILGSVILCGTFRRISQLKENAHTLNLGNWLLYLSFTISQFLDLILSTVFDLIFYCVTLHTLYIPFTVYMYFSMGEYNIPRLKRLGLNFLEMHSTSVNPAALSINLLAFYHDFRFLFSLYPTRFLFCFSRILLVY